MRTLLLGLPFLLSACGVLGGTDADPDVDGDGFPLSEDCDDGNPAAHPGGVERCDNKDVDEDCNGLVNNDDPGVTQQNTYFVDADDDGYGDVDTTTLACDIDDGLSSEAGDCDDGNDEIHPSATEVCDDADADEDCNGVADDEDPDVDPVDFSLWYPDDDGDAYGTDVRELYGCDAPTGWVTNILDCDDHDDAINPDELELCDGIDNDCDGYADGDEAADATVWYADADEDGYGDSDKSRSACAQPDGFISAGGDCDDARPLVHPGGTETCNGHDDDCDTQVDEAGTDAGTYYADADSDGYGDASTPSTACDIPAGYVDNDDDCDDAASGTNPGATEVCDTADLDEDCDGYADDNDGGTSSTGKTTLYYDSDGDTYGDATVSMLRCDTSSDWSTNDDDCDDDNATAYPGATEVCDGSDVDEDCDGAADDDDSSVSSSGKTTYYIDADADGYGVSTTSVARCDLPTGYSTYSTDCDDADAARDPGNTEVCDAGDVDEDCDGLADDTDSSATGETSWYADADADGYGDASGTGTARCNQPSGYAAGNTDCDDGDDTINPGELDVCFDTEDTDCDGTTACVVAASDNDRQLTGEASGDAVGEASIIAGAGDVNSDGYDDLIVGAVGNDSGGSLAGRAYLVHGGATTDVVLSAANGVYTGEDASDTAGSCVAGLGDFDGDGKDDVAVGARGDDDGASAAGAVYILRGPAATTDLSAASYKLRGTASSNYTGSNCAGVGDVNGTGKGALLIGSHYSSSYRGTVYLVTAAASGASSLTGAAAILAGESTSDYAGYSLDGARDVNADGYDDFIIGAPYDDDIGTDAGAAYLFLGPVTGSVSMSTADAKIRGYSSSDVAGYAVAGGGDQNADGYDDLAISAPSYASGTVYVINGPVAGTTGVATVADATISSVATYRMDLGGDVDDDGYGELLLTTTAYTVYNFHGPMSGAMTSADYDLSVSGGTYMGYSVAFVGDHDNDGVSDFALGDPSYVTGGAALLFLGGSL